MCNIAFLLKTTSEVHWQSVCKGMSRPSGMNFLIQFQHIICFHVAYMGLRAYSYSPKYVLVRMCRCCIAFARIIYACGICAFMYQEHLFTTKHEYEKLFKLVSHIFTFAQTTDVSQRQTVPRHAERMGHEQGVQGAPETVTLRQILGEIGSVRRLTWFHFRKVNTRALRMHDCLGIFFVCVAYDNWNDLVVLAH